MAYVCLDPGVPVFGRKGSSIHCQEVMREFQRRGYEIELFATRLGDDVPVDLQAITTHGLIRKLPRESMAREQALIDLNPILAERLKNARPFDLVYERYSLWSFAPMQFADQQNIPGVLEINAPLVQEQKTYRTLSNETEAIALRNRCFQFAQSLIAVSDQVAAKIRQYDAARDKTTVVPNGVNCENFRNAISQHENSPITIGFVGTLKPWHGVSVLLDAFEQAINVNPNIRLTIVGAGPEEQNLKTQLANFSRRARDAVQWLGAIPNAQIPEVLAAFDIAVAPYPDLDDFYFSPLKILEYMAAGRAIVASQIGQIPDLLTHGETGLLVRPGCPNELASALIQLAGDDSARIRLGSAARKSALEKHSWRSVVDRILATVSKRPQHCEIG